ncbi:MAG: hypothetical protein WD602_06200 [Actinomycetota bacterium]
MPNQDQNPGLFFRWLWLVYLPLAVLGLCIVLLVVGALSGSWLWLTALLAVYCVIPARLLAETKRKGLEFPKPPSRAQRSTRAGRRPRPAAGPRPQPAAKPSPQSAASPTTHKRVSPMYRRRRAFVTILGLGVLVGVGGILAIIGIGRATSSSGIILVGLGSFLMILSVTLPAFKIVDAALKAVGRMMKKASAPRAGSHRPRRRG